MHEISEFGDSARVYVRRYNPSPRGYPLVREIYLFMSDRFEGMFYGGTKRKELSEQRNS
jgi:hypothetical protein